MTTERQIEKGISDILGVFTDPIIVYPGGWGDSLPEWLKNAITLERLMDNMKTEITGTDAEACAYLHTASLTMPMDSDWNQIYLYVAGKTYKRWNKGDMPDDIRVESLSEQQMADLNRLKEWLYHRRTTVMEELERVERRQRKEEGIAKRRTEQPVLFMF